MATNHQFWAPRRNGGGHRLRKVHFSQLSKLLDLDLRSGRGHTIAHTDVTLTWSKVKVKVTDLLKFRKLQFSTSTSSAILAWHSQLMGDYDSMGPSLQLFGARFLNFPPVSGHVTSNFAKCWYHQNPLHFISTLAGARSLWLWLHVGRNILCTLAAMTVSPLVGLFY